MDFYFWGVVKDKVYTENPKTISNLKSTTEEALTHTQFENKNDIN
jgi:hypothetical protein